MTISTQLVIGMTEGRINVDKLNNARMFKEFGLSQQDYALILDIGSSSVTFRQKIRAVRSRRGGDDAR